MSRVSSRLSRYIYWTVMPQRMSFYADNEFISRNATINTSLSRAYSLFNATKFAAKCMDSILCFVCLTRIRGAVGAKTKWEINTAIAVDAGYVWKPEELKICQTMQRELGAPTPIGVFSIKLKLFDDQSRPDRSTTWRCEVRLFRSRSCGLHAPRFRVQVGLATRIDYAPVRDSRIMRLGRKYRGIAACVPDEPRRRQRGKNR